MAIFRTLQALRIKSKHVEFTRPFLTSLSLPSTQSQSGRPAILSSPLRAPSQPHLPFRSTHFLSHPFSLSSSYGVSLSPLSKLIVFPFHGPLFLSSPPWKLSQSATPLHVQGDAVLPRKILALKLLRSSTAKLPIKLGLVKSPDLGRERARDKEELSAAVISGDYKVGLAESFLNLPNYVSLARMVSGPVLGWMIINEMYIPAFVGLAISGASDWLDGFLARRMGINSVVGSYLDPFADKVLIASVALAMVNNNLLHSGLVGLVVFRDVALVGGAVYTRASRLGWEWKSWTDFVNLDGERPERIEPLFISKVNTVFQLILVAGALLQPDLGTPETQSYITYLSWLVASTTVASTAAYGAQYMRNRSISLLKGQ